MAPGHKVWWIGLVLILLCLPAQSFAADTTPTDAPTPAHLKSLAQLASDTPDVRDQAVTELMADESLSQAMLGKLYAQSDDPQQRTSLRQVALHQTIRLMTQRAGHGRNDRGILGLAPVGQSARQRSSKLPTGVIVRWTYPGSPAYVYLRPGDLITAVNGQDVPDAATDRQITLQFINLVGSHKAGATLSLHIYRDGKQMDIKLQLGSSAALQSVYQGDGGGLRRILTPACEAKVRQALGALQAMAPPTAVMTLTLPPVTPTAENTKKGSSQNRNNTHPL